MLTIVVVLTDILRKGEIKMNELEKIGCGCFIVALILFIAVIILDKIF